MGPSERDFTLVSIYPYEELVFSSFHSSMTPAAKVSIILCEWDQLQDKADSMSMAGGTHGKTLVLFPEILY